MENQIPCEKKIKLLKHLDQYKSHINLVSEHVAGDLNMILPPYLHQLASIVLGRQGHSVNFRTKFIGSAEGLGATTTSSVPQRVDILIVITPTKSNHK